MRMESMPEFESLIDKAKTEKLFKDLEDKVRGAPRLRQNTPTLYGNHTDPERQLCAKFGTPGANLGRRRLVSQKKKTTSVPKNWTTSVPQKLQVS